MTWREVIPGIFEGIPSEQQEETELEAHIKMSGIPLSTLKTKRLETWHHRGSGNEPWWHKIEEYGEGSYEHPFLTFSGTVGTGKTHLALGVGWAWLECGRVVLYYQVENLLDALRHGYSSWQRGDPDGYQSILAFAQNTALLILDDLGAQHETEWAGSKLDQIIDYRYINGRPLIVTTNSALDILPARIADRLREGMLVHLKGESYRKKRV